MANRNRNLARRLILLGVVVVFVAGLAIGGKMLYDKGLSREGVFAKAERAFNEGRFVEAAALANETLQSQPDNVRARELLIYALVASEQFDLARQRAEKFFADGKGNEFAGVALCELAMRQGRFDDAERVARLLVDSRPDNAYRTIGYLQDLGGLRNDDWRLRLAAAATMRNLASLTEHDEVKAVALLFSGTVMLEVAKHHPTPEGVIRQARADLKAAETAVDKAKKGDRTLLRGRIRSLSENESEAELGASTLRGYARGVARDEAAVAALAAYHLRRGEWNDALALIQDIKDPYRWHRVFWNVREAGQLDLALKMLESDLLEDQRDRDRLRAGLLIQLGDDAQRQEGAAILKAIVADPEAEPDHVVHALLVLASEFDLETARAAAAAAKLEESENPRIRALLATLLAASETDRERGLELIRRVVNEAGGDTESIGAERILSGASGAALEGWLDARIAKGGEDAYQYRLRRALTLLAQMRTTKDPAARDEIKERVRLDIEELLADKGANKISLAGAFDVAAAVGATDLAGRLLARAVLMDGPPALLDQRVLRFAVMLPNEKVARELADGLRAGAKGSSAAAYLRALADAIAARAANLPDIGRAFEKAAEEEGSAVPAGEIAARIAFGENDLDRAERLARAVVARDPGRRDAIEIIGGVLMQRGRFQEVVDLYAPYAKDEPALGAQQVVGALLQLDRKEEALAHARKLVELLPRNPAAHFLLARLYLDMGEPRKALSVLSIAPLSPLVAHMRAELLQQFGDDAMAEQLYHGLLVSSNYSDRIAWGGLRNVLERANRVAEFAALTERVLSTDRVKLPPKTRAFLHMLRGNSFEIEGKLPEALRDYEAAVKLDGNNWSALNNAAWLIATLAPLRIDTAQEYVDRALKLAQSDTSGDRSGLPTIYDTAAEVYAAKREYDRAVGFMDNALALKPAGKMAKYMVHKARILVSAEREDEAKVLLERVRAEYPDDKATNAAKDLLWEIERKNQPEDGEEEKTEQPVKKEAANG